MKESAEQRTAKVGGCVCLAEAEKDGMLQQNKQQKDPRVDWQNRKPKTDSVYGKRNSPKSDKPSFSQKNRVYLQKSRVYQRKTWFFSRKTRFFRKTEFLCQINLVFLKNRVFL